MTRGRSFRWDSEEPDQGGKGQLEARWDNKCQIRCGYWRKDGWGWVSSKVIGYQMQVGIKTCDDGIPDR